MSESNFDFEDRRSDGNQDGGAMPAGTESSSVVQEPVIPQLESHDYEVQGLSEEETKDPDSVVITVSDTTTPIVILFGSKTSGKTMTLIRLTRYLESRGYKVVPDPLFRPGRDSHYQYTCRDFRNLVNANTAPKGTDIMSFMLVKVISPSGKALCQILEAPGEHYFDPAFPDRPLRTYLTQLNGLPNRRTWCFIVEKDWNDNDGAVTRTQYAHRITQMQGLIAQAQHRPQDRFIFTCHKVDRDPSGTNFDPSGKPRTLALRNSIKGQYPGIFERYKNRNPLTRWFSPYTFSFIPFSAGTFNPTQDKQKVMYIPGPDIYPEMLWKAIKKNI